VRYSLPPGTATFAGRDADAAVAAETDALTET
jgi:hypothetical protein